MKRIDELSPNYGSSVNYVSPVILREIPRGDCYNWMYSGCIQRPVTIPDVPQRNPRSDDTWRERDAGVGFKNPLRLSER